jgi:uncharacterized protein YjbJ (UPF0337 family)
MTNKNNRTDSEEATANRTGGAINQIKGNVKEAWGDLTNDPETRREGARDRIKGNLQEEYGRTKEKESRLERDLDDIDSGRV